MTQCWLRSCCTGSQLPAVPGWQRGGSREPLVVGGNQPGGVGEGGCTDTPHLARELELSLTGSVPKAAGTVATHSAMGIRGWPRPPGPAGSARPFGRGDLRVWPRGR